MNLSRTAHTKAHLMIISLFILSLYLGTISAKSIKIITRPVHEEIQEKSDFEKPKYIIPGMVNYGNPLSGNSKMSEAQLARLHSQNQQAMFNAERSRQQRAQLLRYKTAPTPDSYMMAYHDTQEKHQLDVEKQQIRQQKSLPTNTQHNNNKKIHNSRPANEMRYKTPIKLQPHRFMDPDVIKITTADAVKEEKNRNQRSHGSLLRYSQPDRTQSVFVSPAPFGDQGVTIKPHSNIGITNAQDAQPTPSSVELFTQAIPSHTQVIYPKHYLQMQGYKSAQETALNTLLSKTPEDQLSGLNALVQPMALEQPIDLFFYAKDQPAVQHTPVHIPEHQHSTPTYGAAYRHHYRPVAIKDHTPITEQVDDIDDPNKQQKVKTYGVQSVLAEEPKDHKMTTNNYYKVEVASQIYANKDPKYYGQSETHYGNQNDLEEQYIQHMKDLHHHNEVSHSEDAGETHHHSNVRGIHPLVSEDYENLQYAANYEFGYRVRDPHSGNEFGHSETKDGEDVKGHYHVLLPDGRLQNVKYWAGPEGYHAHVSYDDTEHEQK